MAIATLDTWHDVVQTRSIKGLRDLLADDVVFHSPVVHTPQAGKAGTTQYEIDGMTVNGVDIRPLKAINLIHQKMAAMLQANQ